MNFTQEQLKRLNEEVGSMRSELHELNSKILSSKENMIAYDEEYYSLRDVLKWNDKLLGGLFSKHPDKLKRSSELVRLFGQVEKETKILNEHSEKLRLRIGKKYFDFLTKNDSVYVAIFASERLVRQLLDGASNYHIMLLKAHQGVIDALIWTNWDSLIKHPEASKRLKGFRDQTTNFQSLFDKFNSTNPDFQNYHVHLDDYIKFSTEAEAMNSFTKILDKTKGIIHFAKTNIKELKSRSKQKETELDRQLSS
ncbi:MAG: chromosome segregation ATPase [Marinoscillum sp.]|jgi:hypothetical protein